MNETSNLVFKVRPSRTYKLRIINASGFLSQYFWIEGHSFDVIEVDGVYVEPHRASMIYIVAGQRYTILLSTKHHSHKNYPMIAAADTAMLDKIPDGLNVNATGWLVYDSHKPMRNPHFAEKFEQLNDMDLVPLEKMRALEPTRSITFEVSMDMFDDGITRFKFNDTTYIPPKVPVLYTLLENNSVTSDSTIFDSDDSIYTIEKDEIIEVVINNHNAGLHPFHLHGHAFQVIERSNSSGTEKCPLEYDPNAPKNVSEYPVLRDTYYVERYGYAVIRFKANNPGVWFFHCHIDWHLIQGLAIVFIEAPEHIRRREHIPKDFLENCGDYYISDTATDDEIYDPAIILEIQETTCFFCSKLLRIIFTYIAYSGLFAVLAAGLLVWFGASCLVWCFAIIDNK
ncbi:multicopper oxidase [Dipodascopsis uninucleata]